MRTAIKANVYGTGGSGDQLSETKGQLRKAQKNQTHLRILETTDLHMHLLPYDYFADQPRLDLGLSLVAELIEAARAEVSTSLLFDNGDLLQGNPMGDFLANRHNSDPTEINPMIAAMNLLEYDAATVGNHDFNYGLSYLRHATDQAKFPFVLSNAITRRGEAPEQDTLLYDPFVILPKTVQMGDGRSEVLNIGVIGFVPPQITVWDFRHLVGQVITRDILDSARTWVPIMKKAGADLIVALCHSGIGPAREIRGMENAATALAAVPGIDVVLAGHAHQHFPGHDIPMGAHVDPGAGTLYGKPSVMAGFWGSHLGVIDVLLEKSDNGWSCRDSRSNLISVNSNPSEATTGRQIRKAIEATVAPLHNKTLDYIRRPVGKTQIDMHTYFARVSGSAAVALVAEAQRWYLQARLSGTRYADLPLLSAAAAFKAGGRGGAGFYTDVPKGQLTIRNISDLYLYPNTIQALQITGCELREWLERSASQFLQIAENHADQPLLDVTFPSYDYDMIQGISYEIDPTQPARYDRLGRLINPDARRISSLHHYGENVADEDVFIVATNSYRATGGGNFPGARIENVVYEAPDMVRDVLLQYIADSGGIRDVTPFNWRLRSFPGTSAFFESAPRGAECIPELAHGHIEHLGPGQSGFDRYRFQF